MFLKRNFVIWCRLTNFLIRKAKQNKKCIFFDKSLFWSLGSRSTRAHIFNFVRRKIASTKHKIRNPKLYYSFKCHPKKEESHTIRTNVFGIGNCMIWGLPSAVPVLFFLFLTRSRFHSLKTTKWHDISFFSLRTKLRGFLDDDELLNVIRNWWERVNEWLEREKKVNWNVS